VSNVSSSSSSGVSFFGLLTIVLLVLKLTGLVVMSWFWVFAPFLFCLVAAFVFVFVALRYSK
jgi:hypothetical protein